MVVLCVRVCVCVVVVVVVGGSMGGRASDEVPQSRVICGVGFGSVSNSGSRSVQVQAASVRPGTRSARP